MSKNLNLVIALKEFLRLKLNVYEYFKFSLNNQVIRFNL